ncbi:Bud-site selection protein [Trichophaea hybrida]|nr:Bud-site selection protein [Trichophaea hybrida]
MAPKRKNPFPPPTTTHKRIKSPASTDVLPSRAIQTVHVAVTSSVTTGTKAVFRALKHAKTFETRKLIKRLKSARNENAAAETVSKLEAQLEVVKALGGEDLNTLASEHVLRSLGKRKRVVASTLWPPALVIPPTEEGVEKARMNVLSRMYGAAVVKDAVREVVESVQVAMGLEEGGLEEKKECVEEEEEKENDVFLKLKERREKVRARERAAAVVERQDSVELSDGDRVVEESEEFMGFSDTNNEDTATATDDDKMVMGEDEMWERIMDPESTDLADFEERIGASDSDDHEDIHNQLERTDDEWSGSDADDEKDEVVPSATTSPPPPPPQKQKTPAAAAPPQKEKEKKPKAPVATSHFLPSLMCGYVSGRDSDPDADWYKKQGKKRGPPEKKERKNRMGQQARRALWERKFGKRANHVQKEEQEEREKRERKEAKASKRAAAGEKTQEGPLHPSWEAARKAKEKQAQVAAALMKPQGKKITFD